jgi:hypothetical protein
MVMLRTNTLVSSESFLLLTCLNKQLALLFLRLSLSFHIAVLIYYTQATSVSTMNLPSIGLPVV